MEAFHGSMCRSLQRCGLLHILRRTISTLPQIMAEERGTTHVGEGKGLSSTDSQTVSTENGMPTERNRSHANARKVDSSRSASDAAEGKGAGEDGGEFSEGSTLTGAGGKTFLGGFKRMPTTARVVRKGPVTWASLALLVMTGAGLLYYFDREKKRRLAAMRQGPAEVKPGPAAGKAAIGGPFHLVNQDGKDITDEDLKGNWNLIYFGFTHCPDICPDELQKMVQAIDVVDKKLATNVVPIFISVDPERDGVEQVREYVKEFHPNLIGLTGSADAVRQVARAYRVYYMKTDENDSDYLVDHSIIMYLMDPNMEFVKFFGKNYDVDGLADGIIEEIKIKGDTSLKDGSNQGEVTSNNPRSKGADSKQNT